MQLYKYRFLLWQFIAAADTGRYDSITTEEISRHAEAGTISAFLVDRFGTDLDLSIFETEDWQVINDEWASLDNAVDASRKFGVDNKGICLLMAYALECMQRMQREEKDAA